VGDLSLDAVEAYVDLTEGQGPIYDAGFVESHVAVRWERDDQDQDLVVLGRLGEERASSSGATTLAVRASPGRCSRRSR
jgi:hypothetical protein